MSGDLFPPNDRGTVRTIPSQLWFSLCDMLLLNFGKVEDASTLRIAIYMVMAGCGLIDMPTQMDPAPEKESAQPLVTRPGQAIARYEFRNIGDFGRTEVVRTGDTFASAAANPTPTRPRQIFCA